MLASICTLPDAYDQKLAPDTWLLNVLEGEAVFQELWLDKASLGVKLKGSCKESQIIEGMGLLALSVLTPFELCLLQGAKAQWHFLYLATQMKLVCEDMALFQHGGRSVMSACAVEHHFQGAVRSYHTIQRKLLPAKDYFYCLWTIVQRKLPKSPKSYHTIS